MQRGALAARELGCWDCHRQRAGDEAAGPSLFGGSRDPEVLRRRLREVPAHGGGPPPRDAADIAAWIAVVQLESDRRSRTQAPAGTLAGAERLARRHCFGCHGELGQGGTRNPGSLKGYVPGFFGRDFDALTRGGDREIVRQWIRDGMPQAFRRGVSLLRLGGWLNGRAQVVMPGYTRRLRPEEVDRLVRYVLLLRSLGPLGAEDVARYRELALESGSGPTSLRSPARP